MLKIALAKGRLGNQTIEAFQKLGMCQTVDLKSRKLIFSEDGIEYIFVKPSDVHTYVKQGVADIGVLGKDVILEEDGGVFELLDLGLGKCTLSACGVKGKNYEDTDGVLKIATKYNESTKMKFKEKNQAIELFHLNGSVELAPIVGLSDIIVDIVETGSTLKANGLEVIEDLIDISARLIANRVSYRFKYNEIKDIEAKLASVLEV